MTKINIIIATSLVFPVLSACAVDQNNIEKSISLNGGSTLHQFKDGKMAMENEFGRPVRLKEGAVVQTVDGQSITIKGNEVARLSNVMRKHMGGGQR